MENDCKTIVNRLTDEFVVTNTFSHRSKLFPIPSKAGLEHPAQSQCLIDQTQGIVASPENKITLFQSMGKKADGILELCTIQKSVRPTLVTHGLASCVGASINSDYRILVHAEKIAGYLRNLFAYGLWVMAKEHYDIRQLDRVHLRTAASGKEHLKSYENQIRELFAHIGISNCTIQSTASDKQHTSKTVR